MDEFWKEFKRDFLKSKSIKNMKRVIMRDCHRFTLRSMKMYILFNFSIQTMSLLLSYIFYPKSLHYSILTHLMSYLGNYHINPGWPFFSLFLILVSLSLLPLIRELLHVLDTKSLWGRNLTWICYIIAVFSLAMVGFFPDTQIKGDIIAKIHIWFSLQAVSFFAIAGAITWGRGSELFSRQRVYRIGYVYYAGLLCMLVTHAIRQLNHLQFPGPGLLSFALWEWLLFFGYLVFFYAMVLETTQIKYTISPSISHSQDNSTLVCINSLESKKND
jgi:hypothetical protein